MRSSIQTMATLRLHRDSKTFVYKLLDLWLTVDLLKKEKAPIPFLQLVGAIAREQCEAQLIWVTKQISEI